MVVVMDLLMIYKDLDKKLDDNNNKKLLFLFRTTKEEKYV